MASSKRAAENRERRSARPEVDPMAPRQREEIVRTGRKLIKVKALRTGYYDHARRREGDVFNLKERTHSVSGKIISADEQFSAEWMEEVDPGTPESHSTAQGAINKEHEILKVGALTKTATEEVI